VIRLIEGDCRDVMPVEADVVITDPPYAVDRDGMMLGQISENYSEKGTHSRGYADHDPDAFRELMVPAFDGMFRSIPKGASALVFCGNRTVPEMGSHAATAGFQLLDLIVFAGGGAYAKSTTMFMPRFEVALYLRKPGGVRHLNPSRNIANLWDIPKSRGESDHPTSKPLVWMRRAVEVFAGPDDVILDPFCGGGSTLVAAADLGRSAVGIEKFTAYANITRQRLGFALTHDDYQEAVPA
jgi:DNA modification methylase